MDDDGDLEYSGVFIRGVCAYAIGTKLLCADPIMRFLKTSIHLRAIYI